jgi:hypothetical protein
MGWVEDADVRWEATWGKRQRRMLDRLAKLDKRTDKRLLKDLNAAIAAERSFVSLPEYAIVFAERWLHDNRA